MDICSYKQPFVLCHSCHSCYVTSRHSCYVIRAIRIMLQAAIRVMSGRRWLWRWVASAAIIYVAVWHHELHGAHHELHGAHHEACHEYIMSCMGHHCVGPDLGSQHSHLIEGVI